MTGGGHKQQPCTTPGLCWPGLQRRGTDCLLWGKMLSSKDSAVCFFPSSQSSANCTLGCLYVFQCFQAGEAGLPTGLGLLGTARSPGLGPCQPQRSRLCLCACLFVFN